MRQFTDFWYNIALIPMQRAHFEIENALSCLNWACTTLICVFFFWRRIYRLAPEFTNFIVYNTATLWVSETYFFTSQIYHPKLLGYYYWYWTTVFIGEAIQLLTIYAMFARVLQVWPESRDKRRSIPLMSVVFLLMLALANFAQTGWMEWKSTKSLEFIRENLVLIECGLVCVMILFSIIAAVPLEAPIKGILAGFAVDSSARLIIYAIGVYHHPKGAMFWPLGRILMAVAESLGVYVWLVVMLRTPKNTSQDDIAYRGDLEPYRLDLRNWTNSFGEMVYRLANGARSGIRSWLFNLKYR